MARQVSSTGLMVEQKPIPNDRVVSSAGLMIESLTINPRRIESLGVAFEWDVPQNRRIESLGVAFEWDIPKIRKMESIGVLFEWELSGSISGLAIGSSSIIGNLINITPIYVMPTHFMIDGTLTGNVHIQGINSEQAFINGTLFGELKELGLTSYLWNLAKTKTLAIGVTTSLVCYLNNIEDNFDNTIIQNTLLGFGRLHGLTEGRTYFTFRVNGIAPISGRPFGTIQTKGMSLQFLRTSMAIVIHNDLFTYNGKQLVYPV